MHLVPVIGTEESVVGMLWVFLARENADLRRAHRLEKAMKSIASELEDLGYASRDETERDVPGRNELSQREAEVLELLLSGHRVATVAESLFVSTHTVRNHLKSIFKKTGVHSQADLIRLAKGPREMNTSGNGHRS
jgi:DNA-binding CsgD family transcriptional regulator